MEQTKKFSLLWWATVVVAVLLALLFAIETPISAYAEGNTKGKYMKETVMITASSLADAQTKLKKLNDDTKKTYYLLETPIYKQNGTETYVAYTTTNDKSNAIKSIKAMYMKGGWSYEDYNAYLDKLREQANSLASNLYDAIVEYAANLKDGKKNAKYTKKILETLYEEDPNKNLSDLFLELAAKGSYENARNEMLTFTMQANKDILQSVESILMFACKDSYQSSGEDDPTFLTGLQSTTTLEGLKGYLNNPAYAIFDPYVQDIICSLPLIQEDIRFYMNSGHMIEGLAEEMLMEQEEMILENLPAESDTPIEDYKEEQKAVREDLKSDLTGEELAAAEQVEALDPYLKSLSIADRGHYNNGKTFYTALSECKYTGYVKEDGNNEYENLLGLVMAHEGDVEELRKQYKNEDFYPLIHKLSKGQRGLLKVSFQQLLYSIVVPVEALESMYDNAIKSYNDTAKKEEDKIKKGEKISVYYGVDRSLYQKDSGVALTSEAIVAAKSKPLAHVPSGDEKATLICNLIAFASGATAIAAMLTTVQLGAHLQYLMTKATRSAMNAAMISGDNVLRWFTFFNKKGAVMSGVYKEMLYTMGRVVDPSGAITLFTHEGFNSISISFSSCLNMVLRMGIGIALQWISAVSIAIMIISFLVSAVYPLIAPEEDEPYIDIPRVMCSFEDIFGQKAPKNGETQKDYIYYYGVKNPFLTDADQTRASAAKSKDGKITTNILKHGIGDVANWTLKGLSRQWVALYTSTDEKAGKPILASSLTVTEKASAFNDDKDLISVKKFHENAPFDFHAAYAVTVNKNLTPSYLSFKYDNSETHSGSVFSSSPLWGGVIAGLILGCGIGALTTYGIGRKRKKKSVSE